MKNFVLYRYHYDTFETQGVLFCNGTYLADTLELPWVNNTPKISCVPEGTYTMKRIESPHNGTCVAVGGVPERSNIEIHAGNDTKDTEGCILPGLKLSKTLSLSRQKLEGILNALGDETGNLEIKRL